VSSNMITPLHRRLQPCSGWQEMTRAASRSTASALGQGGWCSHISLFSPIVGVAEVTVTNHAGYSSKPLAFEHVTAMCRHNRPFG